MDINPVCRFCLEQNETFEHLLNECPRFITHRREFFNNIPIINDHKWSVQKLIEFSYLPGIDDALQGDTSLRWYGDQENGSSQSSADEPSGIG